jgi:membrane fusion protein, multidrug efflux system
LIDTLHQVVVVPTSAVQRGPDGTFVYLVKDDGTVAMRPVMLTQQDDRQAVIATGVMAQDQVATAGFGRLADGTRVELASADSSGPALAQQPVPRSSAP